MIKALMLAATLATCAVVPSTGQVVVGPFADCRAAGIEVRFQLTELATSDESADIARGKLQEFAAAQAAALDPCADTATETGATVGATLVPPGLHCQEDELIGFTPVDPVPPEGFPLGCVHIDTLTGQ